MKDFVIKPGLYTQFKCGQRAEGLHLNRLIEDVMRENGYPTKSSDCTQPDLCELVAPCLSEIPGGGGVTEFTELTDTPNNYAALPGSSLIINPTSNGVSYGPLIREGFFLNGFNSGWTPDLVDEWQALPQGITRIGSHVFINYQINVPAFLAAQQVTLNVSFPATQSVLAATLKAPTCNAHINAVGTNAAIPVTITRQGGTVGSFNFELTFNAPLGGVVIFLSIQAGA